LSFGPKLEQTCDVAAHGTITAALQFVPDDPQFVQEALIYVEGEDGSLQTLHFVARCTPLLAE
jgi:hypothetical protein